MSNINKEELMRGLSDSQVNKSKQDFGTNALAKKETESLWSMFIGAFDDIWIKVLCAALVMKIVISVIGVFVPALAGENDVVLFWQLHWQPDSVLYPSTATVPEVRHYRKSITRLMRKS